VEVEAIDSIGGGEDEETFSNPSPSSERGDVAETSSSIGRGGASSQAMEWKPSSSSGGEDMFVIGIYRAKLCETKFAAVDAEVMSYKRSRA